MILQYAQEAVVLEGKAVEKLFPVLLPLLDGSRTLEEIDEYVGDQAKPAVHGALRMLQQRRLLTDGPSVASDAAQPIEETAQLLAAVSGDRRTVADSQELLGKVRASIIGGSRVAREIGRVLGSCGLAQLSFLDWPDSSQELGGMDLAIVAPSAADLPRLEEWNRLAIEARIPWLQVLPFDGAIAAVGPLFLPEQTCCHECFRRRRGANLGFEPDHYWSLERSPANYPSTPPVEQLAVGLAGTLALQWLCDPSTGSNISSVPATMHAIEWGPPVSVSQHRVYRVPRCSVCSNADLGSPTPWHQ